MKHTSFIRVSRIAAVRRSLIICCLLFIASHINAVIAKVSVDEEGMKCVRESIKGKCYHKAFERLCNMADHGCVYSQCLLGLMYEKGLAQDVEAVQVELKRK